MTSSSNSQWTGDPYVYPTIGIPPQQYFFSLNDDKMVVPKSFEQELAELINRHSLEGESNTPDFILAEYLKNCLNAFTEASTHRERWYGKKLSVDMRDEPNILQPDTVVTDLGNNLDTTG